MGLKEVKEDILTEAERKADRIVSEAEQEAEDIVEEAEEKADSILEAAEEDIEEQKQSMEKQELSNARMEAKNKKLEAKQNAIEDAFDSFRDELESLSESEREKFVKNCFERTGFEIGEVKASEEFEEAVEQEGFDPDSFEKKGIVVLSDDGNRKQEYSFDRILQNMNDEYRKQVSEVLF